VFAIRPEQVMIAGPEGLTDFANRFLAKVQSVLYAGEVTTYKLELEGGARMQALLPNAAPGRAQLFEVGDPVAVGWRTDAGMFLDA
jgi:spermidine/putrescine transport system ATP-binding protein